MFTNFVYGKLEIPRKGIFPLCVLFFSGMHTFPNLNHIRLFTGTFPDVNEARNAQHKFKKMKT